MLNDYEWKERKQRSKVCKNEVEDGRVVGLYDWCVTTTGLHWQQYLTRFHRYRYTGALGLHRTLLDLEAAHSESENELHLRYAVTPKGS